MLFNNYSIFLYILLFVCIYNIIKRFTEKRIIRNSFLLVGNLLILLTLVKEHTLIVLAALSLLIFYMGKFMQFKRSKAFLSSALVLVLLLFIIRNYSIVQNCLTDSFLDVLNKPILSVQKLGLSYILFRFVHYLIESYKKTIHKPNFITFLNYIFFFPSILAGPIDTYNNFEYWISNTRVKYSRSIFFAGITRIVIGAFKTVGIVPIILIYATDYTSLLPSFDPSTAILISLFAYSVYIYLDFSGYSDIAIGTAYLMGIRTPENFNSPYFSKNLSEFWKRWHMTFSYFLRIYVFKPFIVLYNWIFGTKHRLLISVLCYLSTFLICGLWHGDALNFIYWGMWHGVGLSLNKLFTTLVKPKLSFRDSWYYNYTSGLLTFSFVTIGWMFFHYNSSQLQEIFKLIL
jgi:alginate O-acetyltransferase complex protein AlgI